MDDKRSNFEKLNEAFQLSQELERPSNLPPEKPLKLHRELPQVALKPAKVGAPTKPAKVVYWTTRARADQLSLLKKLMARLELNDEPRTMTDLTIEALDLLLEKYKNVMQPKPAEFRPAV